MKKKILVASGCSFTFEDWNWPTYVANYLDAKLINVGMSSQGNGLISKKAIYKVDQLLKTTSPKDIMVGIMWSGIDRFEFYVDDYPYVSGKGSSGNYDGWIENPTNVIDGHHKNWLITNAGWKLPKSKIWYKYFYYNNASMINTVERILHTQWYLEKMGVDYFMTTYMDILHEPWARNPEVQYLYDMIDFSKFVPVNGCHEWVKENCPRNLGFDGPDEFGNEGQHPTQYGHERFSNEVIIPYLISRENDNNR